MKKGYYSELRAKKELEKEYGKGNVVKIAISQQGADFIVISCGEVVKIVEVKETHSKKYYPRPKEKNQIKRIIEFAKKQGITAELWIYKYKAMGSPAVKEVRVLWGD